MAQQGNEEETAADRTTLFGYFSYSQVLEAMPDMAVIKAKQSDLQAQYEAEMQRVEDEFNKKYEAFLEGQRTFAPSIYKKRQAELTDLMQKNIAFKAEARQQLQQAEADALVPLKAKLDETVARIARERGYPFVLNSDGNALPYVDEVLGEDITQLLLAELSRK